MTGEDNIAIDNLIRIAKDAPNTALLAGNLYSLLVAVKNAGSGGSVASVTGNIVDNTDPDNPVVTGLNPDGSVAGATSQPQEFTNGITIGGIAVVAPKMYRALVSQSGTSAPTATVLGDNSIGNIVWTRDNVGVYKATLAGAFVSGKVFCLKPAGTVDDLTYQVSMDYNSGAPNYILVSTGDSALGNQSDDVLLNTSIEILVYP